MKQAVMLSIKPTWTRPIKKGEKKIEVRRTRPKLLPPYKCYIYETKGRTWQNKNEPPMQDGLGMVVGEFVCDWCDRFERKSSEILELSLGSLVSAKELYEYMGEKDELYGFHISELKVYDKPKPIADFKRWNRTEENSPCAHVYSLYAPCETCKECNLKRAPQSWCYVEELK